MQEIVWTRGTIALEIPRGRLGRISSRWSVGRSRYAKTYSFLTFNVNIFGCSISLLFVGVVVN